MNSSNLHVVCKEEIHYLPSCPCGECIKERKRREKPRQRSHLSLPATTAYLFGFIPSRQSQGSLARELMDKK